MVTERASTAIRIQDQGYRKINSLQWLRAVAALGVVLYHLECGVNVYQGGRPIAKIFSAGALGVPLFFVLSGFVIAMAAVRRPRSSCEFLMGRMARLHPAYLATAGVFVMALALLPSGAANHTPEISWERLMRTLVFDFGQMGGYVYVGWTMFYELCFYLVFSPLAPRFARFYRTAWFKGALLVSLWLCAALGSARIGSFLVGIALFLVFDASSKRGLRISLTLVAGLLVFGWRSPDVLTCGVLLIGLVMLECRWHLNFDWEPMLRLGNASYSIYLVQVLTISGSLKLAQRLSHTNIISFATVALVFGLISTVLAGLAMHRWIEQPGTTLSLTVGERLLRGQAGYKG